MMLKRIAWRPSVSSIVAALLGIHLVLAVGSMRHTSLTWDEPSYIGIGYQLIHTRDLGITALQLHPPLSYYVNSLLLLPLKFDPHTLNSAEYLYHRYIGPALIFESSYSPATIMVLARMPFVILSVLLGILVYRWGRELYGTRAAVLGTFFYCLCPTILAHCRLATADLLVTLTMTLALYAFGRYLRDPSPRHTAFSGATMGLALLSKFTALMLIPTLLFIMIMLWWRPGSTSGRKPIGIAHMKGLPAIAAIVFVVVWAGYGFQFGVPFMPEWLKPEAQRLVSEKPFWRMVEALARRGVRIPAYSYVLGIYTQLAAARGWSENFLFGHISSTGWWYYYWVAFLLKTPVPLIVCIAAALTKSRTITASRDGERFLLLSIVPMVVFFSLPTKINIGVRYILPLIPLICILAGGVARIESRLWKRLLVLLCIWYAGSAMWIYPSFLAYFNELGGGPSNGYRFLVDSNLDWGQDLQELADYLAETNTVSAKIKYFGPPGVLKYYGLESADANDCEPTAGVWAVSATYLQNLYLENRRCHNWLKSLQPKKVIGYSIFIYDVSEEDAQRWRETE